MAKRGFIIMPFSETSERHTEAYWTTLFTAFLKPRIEALGYTCLRSQAQPSNIIKDLLRELFEADLVVSVLTDFNANVWYEPWLTLTGAAAGNYALAFTTAKTTAAIGPRPVTASVTVEDKPYDGTTDATLTSCTLTGILAGDIVACTGTATFDTPKQGKEKTVTVSDLTLTGADAANYVTSTTATTTAAIIPGHSRR
jgi:hypothetical protein